MCSLSSGQVSSREPFGERLYFTSTPGTAWHAPITCPDRHHRLVVGERKELYAQTNGNLVSPLCVLWLSLCTRYESPPRREISHCSPIVFSSRAVMLMAM